MTSSSHAYLQHAVKSSRMDVVESVLGEKLLSVCAGYRPGESLWVHSNGVNGKSTFHRRSSLSWLSKVCNHFGEIDSRSRKSLTLIKQKWRFFGKKRPGPYGQIFTNVFQKPHRGHGNTSFCANFVKFGRPEVGKITRYLMDKKIRIALPLPLLRASRPEFVRAAPNNILWDP